MIENKDHISGMKNIFHNLTKRAVAVSKISTKKNRRKKKQKCKKKCEIESHSFIIEPIHPSLLSENRKKMRVYVLKKDRKSGKMKKKTRILSIKSALLPKKI